MVIVSSSFPERLNTNATIPKQLARGFAELLGIDCVALSHFSSILATIARLRPRLVVLVGSPSAIESDFRNIAVACRLAGACFVFWTVEDPYEFDLSGRVSNLADIFITNDLGALPFYNRQDVYHLPLGCGLSAPMEVSSFQDRSLDLFFCGVGYRNRQVLVHDILPALSGRRALITGDNWSGLDDEVIDNRRVDYSDLLRLYGSAICVLNVGRDFSISNSRNIMAVTPGPRTFDAAAVGCVQLYYRPGASLDRYFCPGKEIASVESIAELIELLDFYTSNLAAAERIAIAAQQRVFSEHTYRHRAQSIMSFVGFSESAPEQLSFSDDGEVVG